MTSLPSETFAWWMGQLKQHGVLHAASLDELPEAASAERYVLGLQQVKSFLVVPLQSGGETLGFCGYSRVRLGGPFEPADEELLREAAGGIGGLLARARSELQAQRFFALETLLAGTARSFVDSDPGNLEGALEKSLKALGSLLPSRTGQPGPDPGRWPAPGALE